MIVKMHLTDSHSEIVRTENVGRLPEAVVLKGDIIDTVYVLRSSGYDEGDNGVLHGTYYRASSLSLVDKPITPAPKKPTRKKK